MSAIYDNWERLVAAAVKKQQLWELFHQPASRSPSVFSEDSDSNSSFRDLSFRIPGAAESSSAPHNWPPKLDVVSDYWPGLQLKDAGAAMAFFELLGAGTFGSAHLATMEDGQRFEVKRLLRPEGVAELDFKRMVEIVGDVRHRNVVALRAYYSSPVEKLMFYDYCSNGSVHSLLHCENRVDLDWQTRGKIAVGAARGIAEIHRQLGGMLVHGNIKASNIFLDQQSYGCVSDLGMTYMMKAAFMSSAMCYTPEVKNTRNVSQASDLYSFGILLLELLTRKTSVHIRGGLVPVDLVKLVKSVKSKERAANVFDPDLLKHPSISKQMVKMLQIGIKCVAESARKRPNIFEVLKMLEDVVALDRANLSQEGKLVFVDDVNPIFELESLLVSSAELLGRGSLGTTSYKVTLDGSIFVVKRLSKVTTTFEDFQKHVELFGRMNHINVGRLKAYYYARDEKLLVYDYYSQGNISALLHGTSVVPRIPLDWGSRVEIALGAARGIAFMHIQSKKLVLGNIKPQNIFLNDHNHSIIAFDAGLSKLMSLDRQWPVLVSEYRAPEVAISGEVSQACDVYSFGVVLLELVCGQTSKDLINHDSSVSLAGWIRSVDRSEWTAEVLDVECLRSENEQTMTQVLEIAMDCVSTDPKHRPAIFELVKVLEDISPEISVQSGFEYILEDLLPMLSS